MILVARNCDYSFGHIPWLDVAFVFDYSVEKCSAGKLETKVLHSSVSVFWSYRFLISLSKCLIKNALYISCGTIVPQISIFSPENNVLSDMPQSC